MTFDEFAMDVIAIVLQLARYVDTGRTFAVFVAVLGLVMVVVGLAAIVRARFVQAGDTADSLLERGAE